MEDPKKQTEPFTREETATLIKELWTALLAPDWARDDLIDLGKTVYAKVSLAKIDDKLYVRLLPQLVKIAESLGLKLREHIGQVAESFEVQLAAAGANCDNLREEKQKLLASYDLLKHDFDVVSSNSKKEIATLRSELDALNIKHLTSKNEITTLRSQLDALSPKSNDDASSEKEHG